MNEWALPWQVGINKLERRANSLLGVIGVRWGIKKEYISYGRSNIKAL